MSPIRTMKGNSVIKEILINLPHLVRTRTMLEEGESHWIPGTTKYLFWGPGEVVIDEDVQNGSSSLYSYTARKRAKPRSEGGPL